MLSFSALSSGSKGNAIVVKSSQSCILIDCGISYRTICARLAAVDIRPGEIDAIFVTHEHSDHISGLSNFLAKHQPIVVCTKETYLCASQYFEVPRERLLFVNTEQTLAFQDLAVEAFSIPHDAVDPVAYFVSSGAASLGVVTDLGVVTPRIKARAATVSALVLEANHDLQMLMNGRYPARLKKRILSKVGHLSNDAAGELIRELSASAVTKPKVIVGAHLSESNNRPELVRDHFCEQWLSGGASSTPTIVVGSVQAPTERFVL